ncbi:hypothetical protein HYU18_02270 [Candidatus Woesearchaeota archaeon]|nr:hypothetical protein [Candidatus Woesearchaeota archaeon]
MQFLQFAGAAVIAYLGLPAGFFLAYLTKEELPTARKYLPVLSSLLFVAVMVLVANYYKFGLALKVVVYAAAIALSIRANSAILFLVLGIALGLASEKDSQALVIAALVFLFGLVSGSVVFPAFQRARLSRKAGLRLLATMLVRNSTFILGVVIGLAAGYAK